MPHHLVLKYLYSKTDLKTDFVFNQTLYTLFREICRNNTFKLFLKTLLKELFTDKGEILSCNSVKLCKNWKNSGCITSQKEINRVQIPHRSNATFKFPPSPGTMHSQMPGVCPGGGCWSFELIGALLQFIAGGFLLERNYLLHFFLFLSFFFRN